MAYSTPLVPALRLISVLCQSSRKIAEVMVKSDLMTSLTKLVEAGTPPPFFFFPFLILPLIFFKYNQIGQK